jgi:hypothetical protein
MSVFGIFRKKRLRQDQSNHWTGTLFEHLNNDLLLEIFDYLSYDDIRSAFVDLNPRINQLIDTYPFSVDCQRCHRLPRHIRSLKLTRNAFFPLLDSLTSDQIVSLRSITLANQRLEDLHYVWQRLHLEHLEYIYCGVCFDRYDEQTLPLVGAHQKMILSLGSKRLTHCILNDLFSIPIEQLPQNLMSLTTLKLVSCPDLVVLSQLLQQTPNLTHLTASTLQNNDQPLAHACSRLRYLSLRPHIPCTSEQLQAFFLVCCPQLITVIIEVYTHRGAKPRLLIDRNRWIDLLPRTLRKFRWISMQNPSIVSLEYLRPPVIPPLREQLSLSPGDDQCSTVVDASLIPYWNMSNHSGIR